LDPRVMKLAGMFLCFSAAAYGLMMWLPGIVSEGTKERPAMAGFLTSVPYLVAIPAMLLASWLSDRWLRRKEFVVGSMFLGCLAFVFARLWGAEHFGLSFVGFVVVGCCLYMPTSPLFAWMAEMLPRNVVGESMALVNSFGALGGFIGTIGVGWLKGYFGTNDAAFVFQACCFGMAGVLGLWAAGGRVGNKAVR
jgi:sugar phosphate permease